MGLKDFLKNFFFYTTVPKCVCCADKLAREERALCGDCYEKYKFMKQVGCQRCGKLLERCKCSNGLLSSYGIRTLVKVFRYIPTNNTDGNIPTNQLIYVIKRVGRYDLVDFLSDEISNSIRYSVADYKNCIITEVPRSKKRVRKYGLDHSQVLAKAVARKLGITYVSILKSKAKKPQKKMGGEERLKNAKFAYKNRPNLDGKRVIILDDIVTTGASMCAAGKLLYGLSASEVIGCAISVV